MQKSVHRENSSPEKGGVPRRSARKRTTGPRSETAQATETTGPLVMGTLGAAILGCLFMVTVKHDRMRDFVYICCDVA